MDLNQAHFRHLGWAAVLLLAACVKTEIIPETLVPRLMVTPAAVSLIVGETFLLSATYTDETGADQSAQLQWSTTAPSVAVVNATGLLAAITPGQTWVVARAPGGLADSTLVTVAPNEAAVAKVEITTTQIILDLGATLQFSATAFNGNDQELTNQTVNWASSNPNVLIISASGLATGQNAGTASITASVAGVNSLPLTVQVISTGGTLRTGTFVSSNGYSTKGTATLQQTADALTLLFGSDFHASNGPNLGVYLAKTATGSLNSQNSLSVGSLVSNDGAQEYALPAGVGLHDYDYVVIYCIPFTVRFGTAQFGD